MTSLERPRRANYDAARVASDMTAKGWIATDLARKAKVSDMTVSRFLRGERQTARVALKLAKALGYSIRRYIVRADLAVSA